MRAVSVLIPILSSFSPLSRYLDKQLDLKLNGKRRVTGVLRGFDDFMNLVLDDAAEVTASGKEPCGTIVIRGNAVVMMECKEAVGKTVYNPKLR
jgi:small nuclear ribonucleoprotein G